MTMFEKGGQPGPGRPAGTQNKATSKARAAIAMFVDDNAHRLQKWLDQIAEGIPRKAPTPEQLAKDDVWERKPNPEQAFTLFQSVIEYHVPKLARNELTGRDGEELFPPTEDDKKAMARFARTYLKEIEQQMKEPINVTKPSTTAARPAADNAPAVPQQGETGKKGPPVA